jgi:predicted DNA-binding transcriptional regulator YafY
MFEFGISKNTLDRDILNLSARFPIGTKRGREGGVYVEDGYELGARHLTEQQAELLERLLPNLEGKDKETMSSILKEFKNYKHN